MAKRGSISALLITQGKHKFYTFTLDSDVLARCTYVASRADDAKHGFQRYLNKVRAEEIAEYVDSGLGTIPSSIVLSAQKDASFEYYSKNKTVAFNLDQHSFLILDGQHRVYGFSLAKNKLRVPVVVYDGLTSQEEVSIFIDLNTKQKPVPNELLLDIKKLANTETDQEKFVNALFDLFDSQKDSCLKGMMSSFKKETGKISRVTFKTSFNPSYSKIGHLQVSKVYSVLNAYLSAFSRHLDSIGASSAMSNPVILSAAIKLFPEVFQRVKDQYDGLYTLANFTKVLEPVFQQLPVSAFKNPGNNKKDFFDRILDVMRSNIEIDF